MPVFNIKVSIMIVCLFVSVQSPTLFISYTRYNLNTSDENFAIFRQSFKLRTLVPCELELTSTFFRSNCVGKVSHLKQGVYIRGSVFKKACFSHVVVMTLQQRSSLIALIDKKMQ